MSTTFSLSNRRLLLDSSEDVYSVIHSVNFEKVATFSVNGNSIGAAAGAAFGEFLDLAAGIKIVNCSDMFSQRKEQIPQTLAAILKGLMHKSRLVELDLSDNAIGPIAVASLVPFLVENQSLRVLKLNNVGFGPTAGTIAAKALHLSALIRSMHSQSLTLRAIICGRSFLAGSASAWSEVFATHANLVAVDIPQNKITEVGLTEIARALKGCRSLRYLNISDNLAREGELDSTRMHPDIDAATAFANALSSWKDLEYFNMSDCCLQASGTTQILDALSEGNNTKLKSLLLENAVFDDGDSFGKKLLKALDRSLPNLITLKLAEHDDLGDTEQGVWTEIVGVISGRRGGVVSFERDIEDAEDTTFLDDLVAGLIDEPASVVEAMAGLSVSHT
ncbi:hypothetical protein B0H12DRAFT_1066819 [Mycena haematopus]|nr:hypothetical protein B0H12DRAFT_1066819 [Mycena haematopus]